MAHHSDVLSDKMQETAQQLGLGATQRFTHGRLNETDEGELQLAIGEENGRVVMNFGKPVAWIGFTPEQAMEIALSLMQHSNKAKA
jgi:hypothetical protein